MRTNKVLAMLIALVMLMTLAVIPAYAAGSYTCTFDAAATAQSGADYTVNLKAQTNGDSMSYMYVELTYDKDNFTYVEASAPKAGAGKYQVKHDEANGVLKLKTSTDNSTYNDEVWFTIKFKANEVDEETATTGFSVALNEDEPWADADYEEGEVSIPEDFAVTIVLTHEAPTFEVAIEGDGVVGQALSANISEFTDNWGLEPEYAYSWKLDGEEVSTEETYTPDADAIGKKATVTVVATVDAEENATSDAVTSAEVEIIADETAQASVKDVKLNPEQPKAGTPVTVEYTFVPSVNGGEDESEIEWYNAAKPADNEEPAELAGKVSEDKKTYTPDAKDYENGVILGVTVTPKGSNDVETGEPVPFEAKEPVAKAKKKSTTSGLNGPSLASSKQESSNNGNGNGTGNNGALDTDKFILTIDQKEASVWGVTKTSDVAPLIKNERTMLPIRFVAENLGFTVGWDEATKTVTITKGDKVITLVIDSDKAIVNDAEVALDSPAYIDVAASRTMVPLRFIAENLDYTVDWIDTLRQVIITK